MKNSLLLLIAVTLLWAHPPARASSDFFTIGRVEQHARAPRDNISAVTEGWKIGANGVRMRDYIFLPCLEAQFSVQEATRASSIYAKAYFYDRDGKLLATAEKPVLGDHGKAGRYVMPGIFEKGKIESVFFALPAEIANQNWQAVVVFGDQNGAAAKLFPSGDVPSTLDYPEKAIVANVMGQQLQRKAAMDPVIEQVTQTGNPKAPTITIFLRPPVGMADASQAKGVLAVCLLANSPADVKRRLQTIETGTDVGFIVEYAQKHQLLILAWGTQRLWDPTKNWNEQAKQVTQEMDENFDDVARAWAKGVNDLHDKYGMPNKNMLLWGISGSAQFSCRLALRKPEYFLAIHAHIPSSFDKPTPEGNHVLWCLTTGEREPGYERSKKFVAECKELGYPIVYKAVIGLGHSWSPKTAAIGAEFFNYALSVQDQRTTYETNLKDPMARMQMVDYDAVHQPWIESFRSPPFFGDIVNQELFPAAQMKMIPAGYRISLPTKALADLWKEK